MLRGLYRVYLYVVYLAMLIFAAVGLGMVLQTIFARTLFADPNNPVTNAAIVQTITFAVVSWVVALIIGGLHYWLIRRDIRSDPAAAGGAIRSFFLNYAEFNIMPLAVGFGASALSMSGTSNAYGVSGIAAFTVSALALWALLDWERRRTQPAPGAATVFQRLHLYGVQLILLIILSINWLSSVGLLVDGIFYGGKGTNSVPCGGFVTCPQGFNLLSLAASTLFIAIFWLWYGFLTRNDTTTLFRRVFHLISFGYSFIYIIVGLNRLFGRILLALFHVSVGPYQLSGNYAQYDYIAPLSFGLITAALYLFWLRQATRGNLSASMTTTRTMQAIAAVLMSFSFWWGCGLLLFNALEALAPSATPLTGESWANALAFIIAGLGYIPLSLFLRSRGGEEAHSLPLRGFIFALLGGGIITIAIGGAVTLYTFGTTLLGSPLNNWQYVAHGGIATLVIGLIVAGFYLWIGIRNGTFKRAPRTTSQPAQPTTPVVPVVPASPTISTQPTAPMVPTTPNTNQTTAIGNILDELLARSISRDEAINRIEQLVGQQK